MERTEMTTAHCLEERIACSERLSLRSSEQRPVQIFFEVISHLDDAIEKTKASLCSERLD